MIKFLNKQNAMLTTCLMSITVLLITVLTHNVNGLTLWFFAMAVLSFAQYVNLTDKK